VPGVRTSATTRKKTQSTLGKTSSGLKSDSDAVFEAETTRRIIEWQERNPHCRSRSAHKQLRGRGLLKKALQGHRCFLIRKVLELHAPHARIPIAGLDAPAGRPYEVCRLGLGECDHAKRAVEDEKAFHITFVFSKSSRTPGRFVGAHLLAFIFLVYRPAMDPMRIHLFPHVSLSGQAE